MLQCLFPLSSEHAAASKPRARLAKIFVISTFDCILLPLYNVICLAQKNKRIEETVPFKVCRYSIAGLPLVSPISELHSLNSLAPPVDSHYIAMRQTLFDLVEARSDAVALHHVLSPDIISILSDSFLSPSFLSHFSFFNNFYILYCILHVCIAGSLPRPSSIQSEPAEVGSGIFASNDVAGGYARHESYLERWESKLQHDIYLPI